jgi:hypothetical protein
VAILTNVPIARVPLGPVHLGRCPECKGALEPHLTLVVETTRVASRRDTTPELLLVCGSCRTRLLIVSLHAAAEGER